MTQSWTKCRIFALKIPFKSFTFYRLGGKHNYGTRSGEVFYQHIVQFNLCLLKRALPDRCQVFLYFIFIYAIFLRQEIDVNTRTDTFSAI